MPALFASDPALHRPAVAASAPFSELVRPSEAVSEAATETSSDGRTTSENGAEAETAGRFQSSAFKKYGGKVGAVVGGAMDKTGKVAQAGASMGVDVLGQGGIGNQGYYDTSHSPRQAKDKHGKAQRMQPLNDTNHDGVANDNPPPTTSPSAGASAGAEDAVFLA